MVTGWTPEEVQFAQGKWSIQTDSVGRWKPRIDLAQGGVPTDPKLPIFLRLARSIVSDIRRGRLTRGEKLPSTRALAHQLGINRNTALAAYRELAAEGWLVMHKARGTFVAEDLPEISLRRARMMRSSLPPRALSPADQSGYDLPRAPLPPREVTARDARLALSGGGLDARLVPVEELSRAYRRALRGQGHSLLHYGDPQGHPALRQALVEMLSARRGIVASADDCVVMAGSQMALYMAARSLFEPGTAIGVEALGYPPLWQSLTVGGLRLVPIPVDEQGIRVDKLRELTAAHGLRGVYVTPSHQYPTTVTLTPGRRVELLEFAESERLIVLEDDYDHEYHYDGRPALALASADPAHVVLYVGSLSTVLAPGLRLGYAVAPRATIERLVRYRTFVDVHTDRVLQVAIAEMLEERELQRYVNRTRRIYEARRDQMVALLRERLGDVLSFDVPTGGMAIWARVDPSIDVTAWAVEAHDAGVAFSPGREFRFDRRKANAARFGFAALNEKELDEATGILADTVPRASASKRMSR